MSETENTGDSIDRADDVQLSVDSYLRAAQQACAAGDDMLGMHLYLTAFEKESSMSYPPSESALNGLRIAWTIAFDRKERTMAEYIFQKLEPFLTTHELPLFAEQLQVLAFDKLAELGIPREELETMANAISDEMFPGAHPFVHVDQVGLPFGMMSMGFSAPDGNASDAEADDAADAAADESADAAATDYDYLRSTFEPAVDTSAANDDYCPSLRDMIGEAVGQGADEHASGEGVSDLDQTLEDAAASLASAKNALAAAQSSDKPRPPAPPVRPGRSAAEEPSITFADLAGYRHAIDLMRSFGVGLQNDDDFQSFVALLNQKHGTDRAPALDTLLFRCDAREDAARFVQAVVGELDVPAMRMTMEENFQGTPVLCLQARSDMRSRFTTLRKGIKGPAVLVLEDLDAWIAPDFEDDDSGCAANSFANMTRGARELIGFIRSAVHDPNIYVLATADAASDVDPFFFDVLEPLSIVLIEAPDADERGEIWEEIARDHESMADVPTADLVRFSEGMSRFDLYEAAREAVDEAYRESLAARAYVPVTASNIYDKLAAYQSLDSSKYGELEEAVVQDFRQDLDHLEDLLNGDE